MLYRNSFIIKPKREKQAMVRSQIEYPMVIEMIGEEIFKDLWAYDENLQKIVT